MSIHKKSNCEDSFIKPESKVGGGFWLRFLTAERSWIRRYLVALLLAGASLYLVALSKEFDEVPLTAIAVVSVILSAIYGGMGPALMDSIVSSVGVDFFFAEPRFQVFDSGNSILRIVTYFGIGFFIAAMMDFLRNFQRKLYCQYTEAERAKKAREEVLAIVSHDLRSSLSSILLNASLAERLMTLGKPAEQAKIQISYILQAGQRMNRMINDLLDASKIDAGTLRIKSVQNEISSIISDALQNMMVIAVEKNISLIQNLPEQTLQAYCDRERIIQVMTNLIENAIKFSPENSRVTLEAERRDHWIEISVVDEGQGLSPDQIPHIFEHRWQARATADRGSGLGLFISNNIIKAHGGHFKVKSEIGKGARFTFTLRRSSQISTAQTAA